MTTMNLAKRAYNGKLTVQQVNDATMEKLETDMWDGYSVLFRASQIGPIKVVEAILDKGINIDGFSEVGIVVAAYY
jgi:hypothetical protein